jgi:hypothetical protein
MAADHDTIHDAIARAQASIRNPRLDGVNPHFRSRYATLGACIDAVRPHLAEQGVAVANDAIVSDGILTVSTVLSRGAESVRLSPLSVPAPAKPQELGSAITYLRRYSLCAALSIVGDADDDGNAAQQAERPAPKPPQRPESDALTDVLKAAGCKSKSDADAVCAFVAGTRDRGVPSDPTERRELSVVVVEAANARPPGGLLAEARAWLAEGA